jgi:hypothetical protein
MHDGRHEKTQLALDHELDTQLVTRRAEADQLLRRFETEDDAPQLA